MEVVPPSLSGRYELVVATLSSIANLCAQLTYCTGPMNPALRALHDWSNVNLNTLLERRSRGETGTDLRYVEVTVSACNNVVKPSLGFKVKTQTLMASLRPPGKKKAQKRFSCHFFRLK